MPREQDKRRDRCCHEHDGARQFSPGKRGFAGLSLALCVPEDRQPESKHDCLRRLEAPSRAEGCCLQVTIDGNKIAWEGKAGSDRATLRGGVTDTYLRAAGQ
jgi:hypothetical protein